MTSFSSLQLHCRLAQGQGSVLPAPCDVVPPSEHDAAAHAAFFQGFGELVNQLAPAFAHHAKGAA